MKTTDIVYATFTLVFYASSLHAATITIDGTNDFPGADTYATSSGGQTGYASADGMNLYLGYDAPAIGSASANQWYLAYLGTGSSGSTSGVAFNTQQPNLPFNGTHLVRWRADGIVADVLAWTGSSWGTSSVTILVGQAGSFLELGIALADLGSPTEVELAAYLLNDQTFSEWSYGVMPNTAFVDGYDPDIGDSLHLNVPEPSGLTIWLSLAGLGLLRRRSI